MSVSKWAWTEECEGQPCPGDCDYCERVATGYISREAVQTVFNNIWDCSDMNFGERDNICVEVNADCASCRWLDTKKAIEKMVMQIPAADVVEVRHGEWDERIVDNDEFDKYGFFRRRFYCSACGDWNTHGASKYCPHCGAKMDGGEAGED